MKVKAMIKQNNLLREQMTPSNRSYFEDMILAMRASSVDAVRAEELLLEAAALLLKGQAKGKNAKQVFGEKPGDYFKDVMDSAPPRAPRSRLKNSLMISWSALTLLFGTMGIAGLITQWSGGPHELFGQLSLFTLVVVGAGSIVLVELIMKWMASLSEDDSPKPKTFDIKALGIYIGIAVIAVFAGLFLDNLFPVIPVSPWVSLALAAAGGLGLKFIFFPS
ncbi:MULTISPECIES: DUF1129 family protein [unclassified Paenibacillus]|uniref:DUF1129 family protein n=1 Tax=unclassified Paenibacillus TaxID=185978 RepID=UPI0003E2AAF6|nr:MULTISPECIES: DUF1129 family protein [unclassified Paenibacillus]ETT53172.1 hypothetical protein C162_07964 [Paenibacillus sp. FSL R7-269]OMF92492.1 hypothetical protein BK147_19485 [Paenibacillus sp. FSL R7-0337]